MSGERLKLTTYFGERDRSEGRLLADALLDLYGEHRLLCSVLLRGAEGFGAPHHIRTDRLLSLSEDLPAVAVAIDSRERIEAVLPSVRQIQHRGLITLERVGAAVSQPPPPGPRFAAAERESKLTIYVGRHQRVGRVPAWVAIVEALHRHHVAGATVLLGVDGTRDGERHRAGFVARNSAVPAMVLAVGGDGPITKALAEIGELPQEPLITLERVRVCKRDGRLICRPHEPPSTPSTSPTSPLLPLMDASLAGLPSTGLPHAQKLTVYTSQAATFDGHPLSLQIMRRLRESHAAGATSLRGIWGFHGAHRPHGDRFFQLRRHVPVVTVAIDTPERIAASFEIIDELTAKEGLVTSELVQAVTVQARAARFR